MRDKYTDIAAQLWCKPQHSMKEMDVEFAMSIAQALRESAAEAFEEAARFVRENVAGSSADGIVLSKRDPRDEQGRALADALIIRAAALRKPAAPNK